MQSNRDESRAGMSRPETLRRDEPAPERWEEVFSEQGDFIDDLLGDQ